MTSSDASNPEIGTTVDAGAVATNVHDVAPTHGRAVAGGTVLLLHGSGPGATAWGTWRPTIPALASSLRVVAPDIPGFGDTQRPADGVYTPSRWVEHLVALLDALGLDRVSVLGNSFGGALALRLATEHPDRVDRLALMGSAGLSLPVTPSLGKVWGYRPSFEAMRGLVDVLTYDTSLVTDDLVRLRFEASTRPGRQEAYEQMFPHPHQEVLDRLAVPEERIATLPHETLVIHGREDGVIPLSSAVRLLELIGRAELHVFGQCGHWTQFRAPRALQHRSLGLLESLVSARSGDIGEWSHWNIPVWPDFPRWIVGAASSDGLSAAISTCDRADMATNRLPRPRGRPADNVHLSDQ